LRDIARNYDTKKLTALVAEDKSADIPPERTVNDLASGSVPTALLQKAPTLPPSADSTQTAKGSAVSVTTTTDTATPPAAPTSDSAPATTNLATPPAVLAFQRKLFNHEPSAVVARMVQNDEIPVAPSKTAANDSSTAATPNANPIKDGVVKFFDNNPDFNLRQKSVLTVLSDPKALDGVPEEHHDEVVQILKVLQRTQALTHVPEAIPALTNAGMTSAFKIAQMPENNFVANHADELGGEDVARNIHAHATNTVIRNDHALTSVLQTVRGSGVAMIGT
jgi:hypothetical protein